MASYIVKGKVTDQNNKPQPGLIIRASDLDFKGENALGRSVITNEHGQYEIEYDSKDFVIAGRETTAADLVVRAFDVNGTLLAKSPLLRGSQQSPEQQNGKEPVQINLVLDVDTNVESSPLVCGTVRIDGTPTKNILVSACDQDLPSKKSDELLGQCRTDEFGHYYIPYQLKGARKIERGSADVYIKVASGDQRFESAQSATVFNAGLDTVLDLELKGKAKVDNTAEFDRYLTILSPVLGGLAIDALTAEDLSFLANETGITADHLNHLRLSHQWEVEGALLKLEIKAYTFYALLREGFPNDIAYWLDKKPKDYDESIQKAKTDKIIASSSFKINYLTAFVAYKTARPAEDAVKTPLQVVLSAVLAEDIQIKLTQDFIQHEGNMKDFWEKKSTDATYGALIPKIKFGFAVSDLTLQNEVLTQTLLSEDITDTRALVEKNHADWVQWMIFDTTNKSTKPFTFPDSITGETDEEKRAKYANIIMDRLEQKHPADFVVKDLKKPVRYKGAAIWDTVKSESQKPDFDILEFDTDKVPDEEVKKQIIAVQNEVRAYPGFAETIKKSKFWTSEEVKEIPKNATKEKELAFFATSGYDLKKPIGIYFDEIEKMGGDDPLKDEKNADEIKVAIAQRYRLHLIASNAEKAGKLLDSGVFSPHDAVNLSPDIKERMRDHGLSDPEIKEVENKAQEVLTTAQYLASELYIHFNHTNPRVIGNNRETLMLTQNQEASGTRAVGETTYNVVAATYEALFGSTSTCACEHCLSVYSAASYFVDFLHILLKEKDLGSPGQKLLARRPDLQYIKLNCENTNTRVPYIDLVNEIFEIYIAENNLDQQSLIGNSIKTAAEIAKEPEYLLKKAYKVLNEVVYPLNLPFDREYVSTDVYLETTGTSRFEVLQMAGETNEKKLTMAILGLSPGEYELFVNPYQKFYHLLTNLEPDRFNVYREFFSQFDSDNNDFNTFLMVLESRIQINQDNSQEKSLKLLYEAIKDFQLTDAEWDIFKSIFLQTSDKPNIYLPSNLFGLTQFDKPGTATPLSKSISQVSAFIERTGLSMEELVQILKVKSVLPLSSGNQELFYSVLPNTPNADNCNIDQLYLQYKNSKTGVHPVDDFTFVRIYRFIRLWKKLGCSIEMLDRLLQALYKARRRALKEEFRGIIPAFDVFEPGVLTQLAYALILQKQLNWSLEKVTVLFEAEVGNNSDAEKISRKAELAKKINLGMDWDDFEAFASTGKRFTPKQVYNLVLWHQTIRQAGFQAKEMRYLLNNAPNSEKDRLSDEEVLNFSKKLRDGIRKVVANTAAQTELTVDFILEKLKLVYEDATTIQLWSNVLRGEISTTVDFSLPQDGEFLAFDQNLKYTNGKVTFTGFATQSVIEQLRSNVTARLNNEKGRLETQIRNTNQSETERLAALQSQLNAVTLMTTKLPAAIDTIPSAYNSEKQNILSEIKLALPLFLNREEANINNVMTNLEEAKELAAFKIIFEELYDYLTYTFIVQTISNEFKLEVPTAKLLIDTIHQDWKTALKTSLLYPSDTTEVKFWVTPPKTEVYTFEPMVELEGHDPRKPLVAGKFYKAKTDLSTVKWSAPTLKEAEIDEQYLFTDSVFESIKTKMQQLDKFALLVNKFKLSSAELVWISDHPSDFGSIVFGFETTPSFTYQNWQRLADYTLLKKGLGDENGADLLELFRLVNLRPIESSKVREQILYLTQWKESDLTATIQPANFKNEAYLLKLLQEKQFKDKYGFKPSITLPPEGLKNDILSNYTGEAKDALQKKAEDRLRSLRRNALMAYLLQHKKPAERIKTPNDLYEYFFIDVEMEPNVTTSRIVQANATLQLFAQRVLMNLEPEITPDKINQTWYEWMHKYRVWEANRKVFLYPENWIEPELRDDKSEIFKALESELLRGEVSPQEIIQNYIKNLHKISKLKIISICENRDEDGKGFIHVVAKTNNTPAEYYYRCGSARGKTIESFTWTPWKKVETNIDGQSIKITTIDDRLFLIWPTFEKKENPLIKLAYNDEKLNSKYIEIKLNWSECKDGIFSQVHTSEDTLIINEISAIKVEEVSAIFVVEQENRDGVIFRGGTDKTTGFNVSQKDTTKIFFEETLEKIISNVRLNTIENRTNENLVLFVENFSLQFYNINGDIIDSDGINDHPIPDSFKNRIVQGRRFKYYEKIQKIYFKENIELSSFSTNPHYFITQLRNPFNETSRLPYRLITTKTNYLSSNVKWVGSLLQQVYHTSTNDSFTANALHDTFLKRLSKRPIGGNRLLKRTPNGRFFLSVIDSPGESPFSKTFFFQDEKNVFLFPKRYSKEVETHGNGITAPPDYINSDFIIDKYKIILHYHPFTGVLINAKDLSTIYNCQFQDKSGRNLLFEYLPNSEKVDTSQLMERFEFSLHEAYSGYNWELFFHIPLLIANRLSQNQRYQEAQQWYHYIFNPTTSETPPVDGHGGVSRFWQFLPFRQAVAEGKESIVDILKNLYTENPNSPESTSNQIDTWRNDPFNPHAIARKRIQAYMRNVVGKYIENLIQWGDMLFQQDSLESINEATQLYVLAANILGPRPVRVPSPRTAERYNYAELKGKKIDEFGNVLLNFTPKQTNDSRTDVEIATQLKTAQFYFCIPDNTFILKYWDTVADRLFKIRHGQNIEGIERQLELFEPEIDPALLVRARAMGMDIGSVLRDMQAPLPHYRFNVMLQKALEMCAELRGLGSNLLSAIEKKEAEALAMIRQKHELQMLNLVTEIKRDSVQEAQENMNVLNVSLQSANKKLEYYSKKDRINFKEQQALNFTQTAHGYESIAQGFSTIATVAFAVPQFHAQGTATGSSTGGEQVGRVLQAYASIYNALATQLTFASNMAKTDADYDRRKEEWDFQKDLAQIEKQQIDKQILAAEIRKNIAQKDLDNHLQQIENARQIEDFLRSKFSNEELYSWMEREIKTLYNQCYQMVYDYAKRAEKTYRYELGIASSDFIRFGAWDSNRNGLLAGEKLYIGLKQLEKAYLDQNRRELELTKHISLKLLNPLALLQLREQGKCDFSIPEELFDLDFPGHYMRRVKSVSITIPCVAGPYTTINAVLETQKEGRRLRDNKNYDEQIEQNNALIQSIATSSAQNDAGLFELNFRDERYLPFEGAGAISTWTLEMMETPALRQFDYGTIADVIMHLRYTAREDEALKSAALGHLASVREALGQVPHTRLLSLRHDFPNEWHAWKKSGQPFTLKLEEHHFPYFAHLGEITIEGFEVYKKGEFKPLVISSAPNPPTISTDWALTGLSHPKPDENALDYFLVLTYKF